MYPFAYPLPTMGLRMSPSPEGKGSLSPRNRSIYLPPNAQPLGRHHLPSGYPELPLLPRRGPSYCFSTHLPTSSLEFRIFPPGGEKKCPDMCAYTPAMGSVTQGLKKRNLLGNGQGVAPVTQKEFPGIIFAWPPVGVRIQDLLYNWTTGILTPVPVLLAMGSMGHPAHHPQVPHISPPPSLALRTSVQKHRCFDSYSHPGTVRSGIQVVRSPGSKPGVPLCSPRHPRGLADVVCPPHPHSPDIGF